MAQTYLQLVNKVMIALREDQVAGFTEPYTALIAQFVNDAKAEVEDAYAWRALRTEATCATVAGTSTATLTATNDRSYIMDDGAGGGMFFRTDADNESQLTVIPLEQLRRMRLSSDTDNNEPNYVAFSSNGTNLIAHFYPTPDAIYNYKGVFVVPQADLSATTDTLTVPDRPVVRQAVFFAMDERGSEFAGRLETEARKAQQALYQAILSEMASEPMTVTEA